MAKRNKASGEAAHLRTEQNEHLVEFGLLLAQKRERLDLSQRAMAERIGVHQSRISRIEMGCGSPNDVSTARAYAVCYGLDPRETNLWLQILFGTTSEPLKMSEDQSLVTTLTPAQNVAADAHENKNTGLRVLELGEQVQALLLWEEGISLFRKAELLIGITSPQAALAGCKIAHMYVELGDYDSARAEVQRVQGTCATVLNPEIAMELARTQGWIAYVQGDYGQAVHQFEHCLAIAAESGKPRLATHAHHFLGRIYCDWGKTLSRNQGRATHFHNATLHLDTAYSLHLTWGDQGDLAYDIFRKAQLLYAQRRWREARQLRDRARALSGTELISLNIDIEEAALALRETGNVAIARRKAAGALEGWAQVKQPKGMADALHVLAEVQQREGNLAQSLELSVAGLCLYPFEHHLANRQVWKQIALLVQDLGQDHKPTHYAHLIDHMQKQIADRQGNFIYLNHVVADRADEVVQIFHRLRILGQG